MIKSMTAYARAEKNQDDLTVNLEIRSYNSRYLDIALRLPGAYFELEDRVKKFVSEYLKRGRIEIRISVADASEAAASYEIDSTRAKAYLKALESLKTELDLSSDISIDLFAGNNDMIRPSGTDSVIEMDWPIIRECLKEALRDLTEMRKREGDYIAADFNRRLDSVAQWIAQIENGSKDLLCHYQNRLKERISALTEGVVAVDPERIAQEAAFLATKSDITEEIVRAKSHVRQFRKIMDTGENGGPKLNFLLQEFNREFNTMGAKAANTELSHIIVDVRSELEKIREQVQNVE